MQLTWQRDGRAILVLLVVASVTRLAWFNGIHGHDDWAYLFYSRSLANGITGKLEAVETLRGPETSALLYRAR